MNTADTSGNYATPEPSTVKMRLTRAEMKHVKTMTNGQRRAWLKKRNPPPVAKHFAARPEGATDDDHSAAKNAAKRERRARR